MTDIKYTTESGEKTAVIPMTCYNIYGTATVHLNYDDLDGCIEMKPYFLPPTSNLTDKEIFENCNDGGFGYVDILGIHVMIFENYDGHERFLEDREINRLSPQKEKTTISPKEYIEQGGMTTSDDKGLKQKDDKEKG